MTYRCQVTLRPTSGIPADEIVNTYHMDVLTSGALARAAFELAAETFYDTVAAWFSALIASTGHTMSFYDLDDPEPRQPVVPPFEFDLPALPANRLPGELACCMSYRASYVSGSPNARRRGRVYLGPFQSNAVETTGKIKNSVIEDIADAGQTFFNAVNTSGDGSMMVYSPTDAAAREVVSLWVDNEWDIQRRRGSIATFREDRGITGA